ncbi:hypothetical protein [uncultured Rubinisphaera sp.]|uniref:hypothetical protein n=1 Tax=uncultured Rubinisphaera sp. TaxID=1678686 RepID=UPI0030DB8E20|tara:strand:- start:774 stop:1343 length:570 start_codon:yes stop_codon:yes gene_type:complete
MIGKIFVTSSGYDPQKGKHIKDPYLGPNPSMGACRPDIREQLQKGDHIFLISGKVPNLAQVVVGGFEIKEKIPAHEAYFRFPERRLKLLPDGQVTGNVIVTCEGEQHDLDHHNQFLRRINNYIVGTNPIALLTPEEVEEGRQQTLPMLEDIFMKKGNSIRKIVGRHRNLTERQIYQLRNYLNAVKHSVR